MLIRFTAPASVFDANDEPVTSVDVLRTLDGTSSGEAFTDYLGGPSGETDLALLLEPGGYLQYFFNETRNQLDALTEFRASRRLNDSELQTLSDYTRGQWSDGIGENLAGESLDRHGYSIQPDYEELEVVQLDDGIASAGNPAAAIFRAIDADDLNAVVAAIPHCSNVNATLVACSPLRWAIIYEHPDIAIELAKHCDVTSRDVMGSSMLHAVASSQMSDDDSTRVAKALIEAGADVNVTDYREETAAADAEFRKKSQLHALLVGHSQ